MFTILCPDLETPHARMLGAMLRQARFQGYRIVDNWEEASLDLCVLSLGKAALEQWHHYRLIRVNNHGSVFMPMAPAATQDIGARRVVMVGMHPGSLMQTSIGPSNRMVTREELRVWGGVLTGVLNPTSRSVLMPTCGACARTRMKGGGGKRVPAQHWPLELDGAGLCEVHWAKRAQFVKAAEAKKRTKPGSREAQIEGQMEMFAMMKGEKIGGG